MKLLISMFCILFLYSSILSAQSAEITPDALYTDKDHTNASDSNDGRYITDGGTGPFLTIQKMVDVLQPGDTGYIRESSAPYFERLRKSGSSVGGITFTSGGTPEDPITLAGYPNERPTINQQLSKTVDTNQAVAGIFIMLGSNINIKNLEITNVASSGIFTSPGQTAPGVYTENIIIEDVYIHHLYGGDNIGGVRLDYCKGCILRNSEIGHIYNTRESSNTIDSQPYGLHSGVHGFRPAEVLIENNYFHHLNYGVFQKTPNDDLLASNEVRFNIFDNVRKAYLLSLAGANSPAAVNAKFYGNNVLNSGVAVQTNLAEASSQPQNIWVYNNSLYATDSLVSVSGMIGTHIFNNIISNSNSYVVATTPKLISPYNTLTEIEYLDYNNYFDVNKIAFIDNDNPAEFQVSEPSQWADFLANKNPVSISHLPDTNSLTQDPLYEDPTTYKLNSLNRQFLSKGRGGLWPKGLGSYVFGVTIGPEQFNRNRPSGASSLRVVQ